jgi:hypothetical protein
MADKKTKNPHKSSYDIAEELGLMALTPSQFVRHAVVSIRANKPLFVQGRPGLGKTELVHQISAQLNYGIHVERFNGKDPTDLAFPYVYDDDKGQKRHAFTTPGWFVTAKDSLGVNKSGVEFAGITYFLDEFAQALPSMQNRAGEVIDGSLSGNKRHKNSAIILAANFAQDKAATYPVPKQIANRCSCVVLVPDVEDTLRYMAVNNIRPELAAFAKLFPEHLDSYNPDATVNCTPRSLCSISALMDQNPAFDEELALYSSVIGKGAGSQFVGFLKTYRDLPTKEEIIARPDRVRMPDEDKTDVMCALAAMLGRALNKDNAAPIVKFLIRMPIEYCTFALRDAVRRDPELKKVRAVTDWAINHGDVLV